MNKESKHNAFRRGMALLLSAAMAFSLAGCGSAAAAETSSASDEEDTLTSTAMSLLTTGGHSAESGKEETVYVVSDAGGTPEKVIVSNWLKNGDGSDTISDVSDLSDIENTKGDETYTENADGTITWAAGGSDIYYEGTSTDELPMDVNVTYTLDGQQITPDELAGQSGHLAITFSYNNKTQKETEIDGETVTISKPCAVVSGLMLDRETCSNVTVTNGKCVDDGDTCVAVGLAMPGLTDSLGLDKLQDIDTSKVADLIPETVTVEADVADFALTTTISLVSWDLFDDLDLADIEQKVDDANSDADELQSGTQTLIDGAEELAGYLGDLQDGTTELADGAQQLSDGVNSAKSGSDQLTAGLSEMQSQIANLPAGVDQLLAGAQALQDVLKNDDPSTMDLYKALLSMQSGCNSIAYAADGIMSGADQIASGANQISAGAVSGDSSNPGIYEAAQLVAAGLSDAAQNLQSGLTTAAGGVQSSLQATSAALQALQVLQSMDYSSMTEEQQQTVQQALGTMSQALQGSQTADTAVLQGLSGTTLDLSSATAALTAIEQGALSIQSGAQQISAGAKSGDSDNPGIYEAAAAVKQGAQTLSATAGELADAVNTMTDDDNLGAMIAGLQQLSDSSSSLISGVTRLFNGASSLSSGMSTLSSGASDLSDGASTVDSAAGELADGGTTLADGVNQLNDEGIAKIVDLLGGDVTTFYDRLEALKNYGSEDNSYSGCADGVQCTTVYIYKTAEIG